MLQYCCARRCRIMVAIKYGPPSETARGSRGSSSPHEAMLPGFCSCSCPRGGKRRGDPAPAPGEGREEAIFLLLPRGSDKKAPWAESRRHRQHAAAPRTSQDPPHEASSSGTASHPSSFLSFFSRPCAWGRAFLTLINVNFPFAAPRTSQDEKAGPGGFPRAVSGINPGTPTA